MVRFLGLGGALLCVGLTGCSMLSLGAGQLSLINDQVPLATAIAKEPSPERRALLREVPAILAFAQDVVGLRPGRSYLGYYATERTGLTYVVTASKRTRFEPYTWWFPIVGTVEYRSYWDEADARAAANELEAAGYDTWISPSRAYSTLGVLRDPITTTMLREGLPGLVEVVIHELSHAKLFVPGQTAWNEALASFVGERGAELYFEARRFSGSGIQAEARARTARRIAMDRAVDDVYAELEALYASSEADSAKLVRRRACFERLSARLRELYPRDDSRRYHVNNARLLHLHRYTASSRAFEDVWQQSGRQFRKFWPAVEAYARTRL